MLTLIILAPLIAAIAVVALNRNRDIAKYVALAGSTAALVLFPFLDRGIESFGWLSIGKVTFDITTVIAPTGGLLMLAVLLVAPAAFLYSFSFIELPSEQKRFYLEMLAFEAAMLAFAMSGSFVLLFIAWEFLSVISYLMIGFWNEKPRANSAARKAITVVLIGDLALLGAMAILLNSYGTLDFGSIVSAISVAGVPLPAAALLVIAVLTKSAQFPFQEWLPDAMEGPTPAAAFLNSGATAKAGIFVAIVLFPIFAASGALPFLFGLGLVTAVLGTLNAAREKQIKRVMAYSTVQELGLMLMAIGGGAVLAAVYFFFAQSFYKALLVFSAGINAKANEKDGLNDIGGLTRNKAIFITTLFGVLSLLVFVPFSGFFMNLGVASSFGTDLEAYALISSIGLPTSFFVFRWFLLQTKKTGRASVLLNYDTVPKSAALSSALLAGAALLAAVAFPLIPRYINEGLQGLAVVPELPITAGAAAAVAAAVAVGAVLGYLVYRRKKRKAAPRTGRSLADLAYTANVMNAAYAYLAEFFIVLGEGIGGFDAGVNGAFDRFGHAFMKSADAAKRLSAGKINTYVVIFAFGVLLLLFALAIV